MVIQKEIQESVESHIKLMVTQIESYLPFIKISFPFSKNMADACFSLIVGNALSVFINQYTLRMKFPSATDFEDFGKLTLKYRNQVDEFFK